MIPQRAGVGRQGLHIPKVCVGIQIVPGCAGGEAGIGRIRVDAETLQIDGAEVGVTAFVIITTPSVGYFGLADYDYDGLANETERNLGTDMRDPDHDNDGLTDGVEEQYGLDPFTPDADLDEDSDGWSNAVEIGQGTDPHVDDRGLDLDNDGLDTETELILGTDPQDADTDDDGLLDGEEDANQNGTVDIGETDALMADSDGDGDLDGSDGNPFTPDQANELNTSGYTEMVLSGTHVYTSIHIAEETTIRAAGNKPLRLISTTGDVTIAGVIDVSGEAGQNALNNTNMCALGGIGVAGGRVGGVGGVLGDGSGGIGDGAGGGGLKNGASAYSSGGGGAGYGTLGSEGFSYNNPSIYRGTAGSTYSDIYMDPLMAGSGGGGGSSTDTVFVPSVMISNGGGGGAGGGAVYIEAMGTLTITSTGEINADGGRGGNGIAGSNNYAGGGGGGGSGGTIYLKAHVMDNNGRVHADSGSGGTGGRSSRCAGGEAGIGRIRVDAETLQISDAIATEEEFELTTIPMVGYFGPWE